MEKMSPKCGFCLPCVIVLALSTNTYLLLKDAFDMKTIHGVLLYELKGVLTLGFPAALQILFVISGG